MAIVKEKLDSMFESVLVKIGSGKVTCEDFNQLIEAVIGETTPEAVRDRVRRHTIRNATARHIEPETGHQQLTLPVYADRVQPKRKPDHQQSHGRAAIAHAHSARTQARDHALPPRFQSAMEFITTNIGKPLTEALLSTAPDRASLRILAIKLIKSANFDHDWLFDLKNKLGANG